MKGPILAPRRAPFKGKSSEGKGTRRMMDARRTLVLAFSLYLTFIILSRVPYMAQQSFQSTMEDSYEYNLIFTEDGNQSHYYVERYDPEEVGTVEITYKTSSNSLIVEVDNIKELWIRCRSVYDDEGYDVFGVDPQQSSNFYTFYFLERDHLSVNIDSPQKLELLRFEDAPRPQEVWVEGVRWSEGVRYNFTTEAGLALSEVPAGTTSVDIYFKASDQSRPTAKITADPMVVPVGQNVSFSGRGSSDPDGRIVSWVWDFGDGSYAIGKDVEHGFPFTGKFTVILSVKDDDDLLDHDYCDISVISGDGRPRISPHVPDQEVMEDRGTWCIDLSSHFFDPLEICANWSWSLTGLDPSICIFSFHKPDIREDTGGDILCLTPLPNTWGDLRATLWLLCEGVLVDSQTLWVNITSVNDPPLITNTPHLRVHHDTDYTFDYAPYISDLDTPVEELTLQVEDTFEGEPHVDHLKVTYNYPESLLGSTVDVTLIVSDGEDTCEDVVRISITDDVMPRLRKELPDIEMREGEVLVEYLDLDDHFEDPGGSGLVYSVISSHVEITINDDSTIDISSPEEWSGVDDVAFRASDPHGALVEDSIKVTVSPVNDPPRIAKVPNLVVHYDEPYHFDLAPYLADPDNRIEELTLFASDRVFCRFDPLQPTIMILLYPQSFYDMKIQLVVTVSDGMLEDSQLIEVWVTDDHPPDVVTPLPDLTLNEDEVLEDVFDLHDHFYDPDRDVLFYSYGQSKLDIEIEPDGWVNVRADENWYGLETVTFRAIDPFDAIVEDTIQVTVVPVNDPPVFSEIPQQRGNVGEIWFFDLGEYINDVDDPLSALEVTLTSSGEDVELKGLKLMISPSSPGESVVVCSVTDGKLEDSTNVVIVASQEDVQERGNEFSWSMLFLLMVLICPLVLFFIFTSNRAYGDPRVEALLLVDNGKGKLIASRIRDEYREMDPKFLRTIFEEVKDHIHGEGKPQLEWFDLSTYTIVLDKGANLSLAMVLSSGSKSKQKGMIKKITFEMERAYPHRLWDQQDLLDTREDVEELMDLLFKMMTGEAPKVTEEDRDRVRSTTRGGGSRDKDVGKAGVERDLVSTAWASTKDEITSERAVSRTTPNKVKGGGGPPIFDKVDEDILSWDPVDDGDEELPVLDPVSNDEEGLPVWDNTEEDDEIPILCPIVDDDEDLPELEPLEED